MSKKNKPDREQYNAPQWEKIAAIAMAGLIVGLVIYLVVRNQPFADPNLVRILRIVLSVAAGILGATIPGFINVSWSGGGFIIRAGGALALFVITFFGSPNVILPSPPSKSEPTNSLPASPPQVSFSEKITLNEREGNAVRGVPIKVTEIAVGPDGLYAEVFAGPTYRSGGRFNKGDNFTVFVEKCDEFRIVVNDITLRPKDSRMTLEDVKKFGMAGEGLLERNATLIVTGRCPQ